MTKTGTERTKLYRDRRRRGIAMVARVEVSGEVVAALMNNGMLPFEDDSGTRHIRRADVQHAIEGLLEDWVMRQQSD